MQVGGIAAVPAEHCQARGKAEIRRGVCALQKAEIVRLCMLHEIVLSADIQSVYPGKERER